MGVFLALRSLAQADASFPLLDAAQAEVPAPSRGLLHLDAVTSAPDLAQTGLLMPLQDFCPFWILLACNWFGLDGQLAFCLRWWKFGSGAVAEVLLSHRFAVASFRLLSYWEEGFVCGTVFSTSARHCSFRDAQSRVSCHRPLGWFGRSPLCLPQIT